MDAREDRMPAVRRAAVWILMALAALVAVVWAAVALRAPVPGEAASPLMATATQPAPQATVTAPAGSGATVVARTVATPVATASPSPEPVDMPAISTAIEIAPRVALPSTPTPAAGEPTPLPEAIGRIQIPSLHIDQPIVPVSWRIRVIDGQPVAMYDTVKGAVSYHRGSAPIGQPGNTVLTGHTRGDGKGEFQNLWELQRGAEVRVYDAQGTLYRYEVESVITVQEIGLSVEERLQNARYLQPTSDTRLTLVTCWPEWVYTHRVIVIARPRPGSS